MAHTVRIYASWFLLWKIISKQPLSLDVLGVILVWVCFIRIQSFWLHENEMISFQSNTFLSNLNPIFPRNIFLCRKKKKSHPAFHLQPLNQGLSGEGQWLRLWTWPCANASWDGTLSKTLLRYSFNLSPGCLLPVSPFRTKFSHTKNRWTSLDPESCFYYCWISLPDFPNSTCLPLAVSSSHTLVTPQPTPLHLGTCHAVKSGLVKAHDIPTATSNGHLQCEPTDVFLYNTLRTTPPPSEAGCTSLNTGTSSTSSLNVHLAGYSILG